MRSYRRTLSEREAKVLTNLSYAGKAVFTAEDLKELVDDPKNLLDNLVRKKWILRIRKGVYAIAPLEAGEHGAASYTLHSFIIASVLVKPYYIGYWSALNHHGLTDQTPPAVYIATTKPRNSRTILGTRFRFVTLTRRKMFGMEETEIEDRSVVVSSPEKTIADCLDHPEHSGGVEEVAKALHFHSGELEAGKLVEVALQLGNNAVVKRLGLIADSLGLNELSEMVSNVKLATGYPLLDPTLPRRGRIRERWGLVVNAPIDPERWTR
jgi:predicted transcriptional regulator of viral defense system